ncbi:hypothetical protein RHMOL_Rhmol13G0165800 [Rhododendron molle]|uniref:Uncharacterized protein n=1 Tax=Rhododendron molle TaxID=49168 RepID=A0ACC0L8X6_RHOML|nr:hypothetical protein RHMOL_Rhmol13G0165800 [Rhododendron molle]
MRLDVEFIVVYSLSPYNAILGRKLDLRHEGHRVLSPPVCSLHWRFWSFGDHQGRSNGIQEVFYQHYPLQRKAK